MNQVMYIGKAFVGRGPNAAHINVFIGPKDGPVGIALASSVAAPRIGYIRFMVIHKPNVPVKPATLFSAKADLGFLQRYPNINTHSKHK